MAARRPDPPAPITITSYWCRSTSAMSDPPPVPEPTGRRQADVEVRERDEDQAGPGQLHVLGVELGNKAPEREPDGVLREVLQPAPHDVATGVTGQRVGPQQDGIDRQHEGTQADMAPTERSGPRIDEGDH